MFCLGLVFVLFVLFCFVLFPLFISFFPYFPHSCRLRTSCLYVDLLWTTSSVMLISVRFQTLDFLSLCPVFFPYVVSSPRSAALKTNGRIQNTAPPPPPPPPPRPLPLTSFSVSVSRWFGFLTLHHSFFISIHLICVCSRLSVCSTAFVSFHSLLPATACSLRQSLSFCNFCNQCFIALFLRGGGGVLVISSEDSELCGLITKHYLINICLFALFSVCVCFLCFVVLLCCAFLFALFGKIVLIISAYNDYDLHLTTAEDEYGQTGRPGHGLTFLSSPMNFNDNQSHSFSHDYSLDSATASLA